MERKLMKRELGRLKRRDPKAFALEARALLEEGDAGAARGGALFDLLLIGMLALLAGTVMRVPLMFPWIREDEFLARNLPLAALAALAALFGIKKRISARLAAFIAASFVAMAAQLNGVLGGKGGPSMPWVLAHAPCLMLSVAALAYVGDRWRESGAWVGFLRFAVESLIYAVLIGAAAQALLLLGYHIFQIITSRALAQELFFKHLMIYGACASGLTAAWLVDKRHQAEKSLLPAIARIFAPAFAGLLALLVLAMLVTGKNPFLDREFLSICNGILIVALGLSVFSVFEGKSGAVNAVLLLLTLGLDLMTLASILFRLGSYGLTPNRVVVLGVNLLIFATLLVILNAYRKGQGARAAELAVQCLPAYQAWCLLVVFALPALF